MAGDVATGQVLDARGALACALAVGVLQGECIGAAHYRAGRAPSAAAGGGGQLVRRVPRSWPGPCMRLVLGPSRRRHGDVDPGKRADVDQVDVVAVAGDVGAGQLLDARASPAVALLAGHLFGRAPGSAADGGRQLVRRVLRSWPGPCMRLVLAPSRRRHGDVDPGERADVDQVDVAAVAGDVDAGQALDPRAALAGAIAGGVLQAGHQGECIGAAHYRTGRAPGAAAGGGRQLVPGALRPWPGPCMHLVLVPSRRGHGDVDPGERADVDQVDVAPWPATLPLARCSMRARRRALSGRA